MDDGKEIALEARGLVTQVLEGLEVGDRVIVHPGSGSRMASAAQSHHDSRWAGSVGL